jgi:hypothetical protein
MVGKVQRGIDLGDGGPHSGSQHGSPRWGVAAGMSAPVGWWFL